jgi:hypothetical protein
MDCQSISWDDWRKWKFLAVDKFRCPRSNSLDCHAICDVASIPKNGSAPADFGPKNREGVSIGAGDSGSIPSVVGY